MLKNIYKYIFNECDWIIFEKKNGKCLVDFIFVFRNWFVTNFEEISFDKQTFWVFRNTQNIANEGLRQWAVFCLTFDKFSFIYFVGRAAADYPWRCGSVLTSLNIEKKRIWSKKRDEEKASCAAYLYSGFGIFYRRIDETLLRAYVCIVTHALNLIMCHVLFIAHVDKWK